MAITDELRKYARGLFHTRGTVLAIADRIDEEHEREISRAAQLLADAEKDRDLNYANWQDCKQKVLQHNITMDELSAEIERLKDELAHRIELPKDADGEYIHVGDRMENNERVARIVLTDDSWEPSVYLEKLPNVLHEYFCHEISHYHAPTVEDVLREMHAKLDEVTALYVGEAIDSDERDSDEARILAEYADKLRLAGSDEE